MQDASVYQSNTCSHARYVLEFERTGARLHQIVWIVMRCVDCLEELDRRRLTRGERDAVNR